MRTCVCVCVSGERWNEAMMASIGRGLRAMGRDIWQLSIVATVQDVVALLRHPPRWFLIACACFALFVIVYLTLAFTGAVASQAGWLRDQLP